MKSRPLLSAVVKLLLYVSPALLPLQGAVLVELDATNKTAGTSNPTWVNTGTLGGNFISSGSTVPSVGSFSRNSGGGTVNAISFNGRTDWYVGPEALAPTGNQPRSVEVWVANSTAAPEEPLISWARAGGVADSHFSFGWGNSTTLGAANLQGGNSASWGAIPPTTNLWHHLVVTWNGSQLHLYDNAVLKVSKTISGGINTASTYSTGANVKFVVPGQTDLAGMVNGPVNGTATATVSNGAVSGLTITNPGFGYLTAPTVTIALPPAATATGTITNGTLTAIAVNTGSGGYVTAPTVTVGAPPSSIQATATAAIASGSVTTVNVGNAGRVYISAPTVTLSAPPASVTATATATLSGGGVDSVTVTNGGGRYNVAPTVTFENPPGTVAATGTAVISGAGAVTGITVTSPGSGYTTVPAVTLSAPPAAVTATASSAVSGGVVTGFTVTNPGYGYISAPTVSIGAPVTPVQATATATLTSGSVSGFTITAPGAGYSSAPTITLDIPPSSAAATATATISGGVITAITVNDGKKGYTTPPAVTLTASSASPNLGSVIIGKLKVHDTALSPAQIRASHNSSAAAFGIDPIMLPAPVITSFTASPAQFSVATPITLSWTVDDALTMSLDDGLGTVTTLNSASGSLVVNPPSQNAVYTLRASNNFASTSAKAAVVYLNPPIALRNRWSFNEGSGTTVVDSVGGANGTIKGTDWSRTSSRVKLNPTAFANSASSGAAAYIDLPNGILSSKVGDVTIEGWYSLSGAQTNARLFDFGNSSGGEFNGPGGSGSGTEYLSLGAQHQNTINIPGGTASKFIELKKSVTNTQVFASQPYSTTADFHFAVVYDADAAAGSPRLTYYNNGVMVSPQLTTTNRIAELVDVNCFLGRSNNTTDANMQGNFDEFRIWQGAFSDAQVAASYAAGPNAIADPSNKAAVILTQPQNKRVGPGMNTRLSVIAEGTQPITYQWYRNGSAIPGATQNALEFLPATIVDSGDSFYCKVSNTSQTAGPVTVDSAPAVMTVDPLLHRYSFTGNFTDTASGADAVGYSSTISAPPVAGSDSVNIGVAPSVSLTRSDLISTATMIAATVADFNGDLKPDIATAKSSTNNVSVMLNLTTAGAATTTYTSPTAFAVGTGPSDIAAGDLNGDNKADIVAVNTTTNNISVLINTTATNATTPTFSDKVDFAVGSAPGGIAIGDINGDGKLDLAVTNASATNVSVLLNTTPNGAAPTFAAAVNFATGSGPSAVSMADINGDGKIDLIVANSLANTVSVLLNTTAGGAGTPSYSAKVDFAVGTAPKALATGDVNGDGKVDLAVANSTSNTASVLLNTTLALAGTPTMATKVDFASGTTPLAIGLGDLNGDLKVDLVTTNSGSHTVSTRLNTTAIGAAVPDFGAKADASSSTTPRGLVIRDMNADSKPDLVVTAISSFGNVSVFHNTTAHGSSQQYLSLPVAKMEIPKYPAMTVESWASHPIPFSDNSKLFAFGNTVSNQGQSYAQFSPRLTSGTQTRMAFSYLNPAHVEIGVTATGTLEGTTKHVVCVYDVPNNQLRLYVNGIQLGTTSMSARTMNDINLVNAYIGRSLTATDPYLAATLDEFRIYAKALSASEVSANFAAGPNSFTAPTFAITRQPVSLSFAEGTTATAVFTADFVGTPPIEAQWYRNNVAIPGQNALTLAFAPVLADNGTSYYCIATSGANSITSSTATLTVTPDTTPPTFTNAYAEGVSFITLEFSEPLTVTSASNLANYSITAGRTLSNIVLSPDAKTVTLTVTPSMVLGSPYTVTVNNLVDRAAAANLIAPNSQRTIVPSPFSMGTVGSVNPVPLLSFVADGGYKITAGGTGPFQATDQMGFASSSRTGDFDIRIRVAEFPGARNWAQAGLMARENSVTNAPFAASVVTPGAGGSFFSYRSGLGSNTTIAGSFPSAFPNSWLRLRRVGNVFTGYASVDGSAWQILGSTSLSLPSTVLVGPYVSGGDSNLTNFAIFHDYGSVGGGTIASNVKVPIEPVGPTSRRASIILTEFSYNPNAVNGAGNLEFIEIHNCGPIPEELTGWKIKGGINYDFPANTTIQPGTYMVIAADPAALQTAHGITGVLGPWTGSLSNSGESFYLENAADGTMFEVDYKTKNGWPIAANGLGHTVCLLKPSYGEMDPRAWAPSFYPGGSPGKFNPYAPIPQHQIQFNEYLFNSSTPNVNFLELYNASSSPLDLSGCIIGNTTTLTSGYTFPNGTSLAPFSYLSLTEATLGFTFAPTGERVWLKHPTSGILTVIEVGGQEMNVSRNGSMEELTTPTPGTVNSARLSRPIVINEIMYDPISEDSDDEYIELYNTSNAAINLNGWKIGGGIDFSFGPTDSIPALGFIVVAKNVTQLLSRGYTALNSTNTKGNYSGTLSNSGDRIQLLMPVSYNYVFGIGYTTSIVDEVTYGPGGRWPRYAAGGGSSLELIDARADNRLAPNWAESDDSAKAVWTTFTATQIHDYRQIRDATRTELWLQGVGECRVDDISIKSTSNVESVVNGGFESGLSGWTSQGTQANTVLATTGAATGTNCLRVISSDRGDPGASRIWSAISTVPGDGATFTVSAKVKWVKGSRYLHIRTSGNGLELPVKMNVPTNLGTPGAANSKAAANVGPAITDVAHYPILPAASEAVIVTARVADPDGLGTVTLQWRNDTDGGANQNVTMTDNGSGSDATAGDGIYSGTIPGQSTGKVIAFKVLANDNIAPVQSSTFPKPNPLIYPSTLQAVECYVNFGEAQHYGTLGTYRLWISTATNNEWTNRTKNSNSPLDGTFVAGNYRAFYNCSTLYSGSPWHTGAFNGPTGSTTPDYEVEFPPDNTFLGAENFVIQDQDSDNSLMAEIIANWIGRSYGAISNHKRQVNMYVNGLLRGKLYEDAQQPNGDMVKQYQRDAADGTLYKIEDWFEFDDVGTQFGIQDATLPATSTTINGVVQKKMARYRWNWRARATSDPNSYTSIFNLVDVMTAPSNDTTYVQNMQTIVDTRKWLGGILTHHISGDWDSYGYNRGKNAYAYKGLNGKWVQMLWDIDFSFGAGSHGASSDLFETGHPEVATMFNNNAFRRQYLAMALEAANGALTPAKYDPVIDARQNDYLYNNIQAGDPNSQIKTYLTQRRNNILGLIPAASFSATASSTSGHTLTITGNAPVNVHTVLVNGLEYPVTWTGVTSYTVAFPRLSGPNTIVVTGVDSKGNVLFTAPTINSTFTGTVTWQAAKINEWMASNSSGIVDPADGKYEDWFEIYNPTATVLNLAGWYLSDTAANRTQFIIPSGYSIPAGQFMRVWADNETVQSVPGSGAAASLHVNFKLGASGESIILTAPDLTQIDRVDFGQQTSDAAQGRYANGAASLFPLTIPTPAASNIYMTITNITKVGAGPPNITFSTTPSRTYKLWWSENLVQWNLIGTYVATGTELTVPDNGTSGVPRRFYRAMLVNP